MKRMNDVGFGLIALLASAGFAGQAWAEHGKHGEGPCKKIVETCQAGGFVKGGHKEGGKGLWKDCVEPLVSGKPVAGITVDAATIEACKAKRADRKERHEKGKDSSKDE